MFKQVKKFSNITGVATGATITGKIPAQGTLYEILLRIDGTVAEVKSELANIIVRADGEELVNASPTFLFDLEKFYGDALGAGNKATATHSILSIPFARRHLTSDKERSLFALGLADINALTIEVLCGTISTLTTIELFAVMTPENRRMGQHVRIHKFPQAFATTGHQEITDLPRGGVNEAYLAIHIGEGTDTYITDVTVKKGGYSLYDAVTALMHDQILPHNLRTAQANYYHVDFGQSRDLTSFIPMAGVKDWRVDINWNTAPTSYDIYTERIFNLNVTE